MIDTDCRLGPDLSAATMLSVRMHTLETLAAADGYKARRPAVSPARDALDGKCACRSAVAFDGTSPVACPNATAHHHAAERVLPSPLIERLPAACAQVPSASSFDSRTTATCRRPRSWRQRPEKDGV